MKDAKSQTPSSTGKIKTVHVCFVRVYGVLQNVKACFDLPAGVCLSSDSRGVLSFCTHRYELHTTETICRHSSRIDADLTAPAT